jgi:hypothetical protein
MLSIDVTMPVWNIKIVESTFMTYHFINTSPHPSTQKYREEPIVMHFFVGRTSSSFFHHFESIIAQEQEEDQDGKVN